MQTLPPNTESAPHPPAFRLVRYFSLTSLLGVVVVMVVLLWAFRAVTQQHLIEHEGRANADQTRAFANALWSRHRAFVTDPRPRTPDALRADSAVAALDQDVVERMRGLRIAKVKIYNLAGVTVYSTDPAQIGEDKSTNRGFRSAVAGQPVDEITFRERFDAFEGTLNNRNLIASYVPVRHGPENQIEGVFEVYSDVTDLLHAQQQAQWQVAALVLGLLSTLYLFLYIVVRKADAILAHQAADVAAREQQMRHQAFHDVLTGLPNRAAFSDRMRGAIAMASRQGHTTALMFIDLDRFKVVNDSLGHLTGDALLKVAAQRIKACLRSTDALFRMGGDEFTVILPAVAVPEDVAYVARRILEAMSLPVSVHDHELSVGATIGIAVYPGDGPDAESLLKNADAAMYSAKAAGRGQYTFYESEMNRRALQRLEMEVALKKALREDEFSVLYQPRVDARTHRVVALEALLRWDRPGHGQVEPDAFLRILEDTGMVVPLGEWVLRQACAQAQRWQAQTGMPLRVSLNVAPLQFQAADFVTAVERSLRDHAVSASQLEIELTEVALNDPTPSTRANFDRLKALGVRLSIDGFGSGSSALDHLRSYAVDYLKIDRRFIASAEDDPRDGAVARSLIDLARAFGIQVVADGVETAAQARFYGEAGCSELQGLHFSAPVAAARVPGLLATAAPSAGPPALPSRAASEAASQSTSPAQPVA